MSTRVAIAHEWLDSRAGSEKTFEAMGEAFPDADLYALTAEPAVPFAFGGRPVTTTALDRSTFTRRRRDLTLPLMPLAWQALRAPSYDLVLTSSHACVRAFPPARDALHLSYCHTPMRYAWLPDEDGRRRTGPLTRAGLAAMRRWDRATVPLVDEFAANSRAVRDRIRTFYDRDARVIAPPVDTEFFTPGQAGPREGVLAVSRFVPYKRLDLVIRACARLGVPLTVAGSGPQEAELRNLSERCASPVRFLRSPDDVELRAAYRSARALVFPAREDFGIVPVEAQACGTPVVALGEGGSLDTVADGVTGRLVPEQTAAAFADGLAAVLDDAPSAAACRRQSERFSRVRFVRDMVSWADEALGGPGRIQEGGATADAAGRGVAA
jgi:glycosyltransferase involved in cell wall biosynthesis